MNCVTIYLTYINYISQTVDGLFREKSLGVIMGSITAGKEEKMMEISGMTGTQYWKRDEC